MIENKKVSIVISAFNKEKYIKSSIQSVLEQSYKNIELFIVDDGSTDRTYEEIQNYNFLSKENIFITSKKNEGVASCRNIGIEKGSGDYILFLDGDDTLLPDAVYQAVILFERTKSSIVYGGWNYIDENENFIKKFNIPSFDDYLERLLLGNIFAICSVFCDLKFLRSKVGKYKFYTVTDDWEYWIRCAKNNAEFHCSDIIFSNVRVYKDNNKKNLNKQKKRFFPIIDDVFNDNYFLPDKYKKLKNISILRHHFYLMENYIQWNLKELIDEQFEKIIEIIKISKIDIKFYYEFIYLLNFKNFLIILSLQKFNIKNYMKLFFYKFYKINKLRIVIKFIFNKMCFFKNFFSSKISLIQTKNILVQKFLDENKKLDSDIDILTIREKTISFIEEMKIKKKNKLIGYRFSKNSFQPTCYNLIFVLLIKHLMNIKDEGIDREIEILLNYQKNDGYFKDMKIASKYTNGNLGGWGWEHLTLHAIMVLALYDIKPKINIPIFYKINNSNELQEWLQNMDINEQAVEAGNKIQNFATSIQFKRDYESYEDKNNYLSQIYEFLEKNQNKNNGLFGFKYLTKKNLMHGIIGAYHIWLLYFYDRKEIKNSEKIINSLLNNQNIGGGFGIFLNSSACEDIDSVDPLVRLYLQNDKKNRNIESCLEKFLPSLLKNMNDDGSWVFRRNEACYLFSNNMYSKANNGNLFYTWFRLLNLGYMSKVLANKNENFWNFKFKFKRSPGHQFLNEKDI